MQDALDKIGAGCRDFLARLGYVEENGVYRITKPSDDKVALFCHAGTGRILISHLLHIPLHLVWAGFNYNHTGVTVIEFKNQKTGFTVPRMLCHSDTSHLYAHGPDMKYCGRTEI
jgi:probable phosphoglycerate mutase